MSNKNSNTNLSVNEVKFKNLKNSCGYISINDIIWL